MRILARTSRVPAPTAPRAAAAAVLGAALVAAPLAVPPAAPTAAAAVAGSTATSAAPASKAPATTARATTGRAITYTAWDSGADLSAGTPAGVTVARGAVRLDQPTRRQQYAGSTYDVGTWTSPWTTPGFELTELVPSWEATTPAGTFVTVQVRGRTAAGASSSWDVLGRWASHDDGFRRTSAGAQTDDLARVDYDTLLPDTGFATWQVRVTLHRRTGTTATPLLDAVGAVASRLPRTADVATSAPGVAGGVVLPVPTYSQMTHDGHYEQWGGGGEAWCSPTSLAMVLGYYDALPPGTETAWLGRHGDRVVDHLARRTYDYGYRGTGNWPFNTAEAATRVRQAFVTRFASLRPVERFVKAGIPVITSITFGYKELRNSPITASAGHLLVVVGFTASGDVVVNDPAADPAKGQRVRRTYDRGQFEDAWLSRGTSAGGSGGLAYVVRDADRSLPARRGATSW